jgi:hypothetical protein
MAGRSRLFRRPVSIILALLCIGLFLSGPNPATSAGPPATLSPFTNNTLNHPFGVAASPGRVLVTDCTMVGSPEVLSVDSSGNISRPAFATLPGTCGNGVENYIAVAPAPTSPVAAQGLPTPNAAGFPSNYAYVAGTTDPPNAVPAVWQVGIDVTSGGAIPSNTPFATFSSLSCGSLTGITFDRVGSFGNRLIVVCSSGQVWLLCGPKPAAQGNPCASNQSMQLLATVPVSGSTVPEGPGVAPQCVAGITCLPGLAGQILIAVGSSSSGKLFAVSSAGVTSVITTSSPESVAFVPHPKCTYATATAPVASSPVYFVADNTNNVLDSLPLNAFAAANFGGNSPGGNALVATEGGKGITLLTTVNGKFVTSTFASSSSVLQGSGFVDCATPFLLTGLVARQDQTINLQTGSGVVTVDILASNPNFNPLTICVGNGFTADGSLPCPAPLNHAPTYGFFGGEQSFAGCASKLTSTPSGTGLACKFFKAKLDLPSSSYSLPLILKLFYIGGGGDGDAEGGG